MSKNGSSTPREKDPLEFIVNTPHYQFKVNTEIKEDSVTLTIGKDPFSCLNLYIRLPEKMDPRIRDLGKFAVLQRINSFIQCSLQDISEDYKSSINFDTFHTLIKSSTNNFAKNFFNIHKNTLEVLYNTSKSFPDFFLNLGKISKLILITLKMNYSTLN